jgi:radical SAM protein with 4Fe4S-binding SPASM domain
VKRILLFGSTGSIGRNVLDIVAKNPDEFRVELPYTMAFPCPQLWQRLVVGWNGNIYMCCGDNVGLTVLGDAKKDKLHEIWHGEKLKKIRELQKNYEFGKISSCKACEFNKYPENKKRWAA